MVKSHLFFCEFRQVVSVHCDGSVNEVELIGFIFEFNSLLHRCISTVQDS